MKLTGKKLLLLLLYSPTVDGKKVNISITGRTRLMKMVFLFGEEILSDFVKDRTFDEILLPEYFAWKYGPFSTMLLNDLEFLINQQYINIGKSKNAPIPAELAEYEYWIEDLDEFEEREYDEEVFELSNRGLTKAQQLWTILSKNQRNLLSQFKTVLNGASLDRILEYVYKKYRSGGFIDKSLIRDKYLS
jgi:uncharacterized protein YwgA